MRIGQWRLVASRWLILVANRSLIFINALYLFTPYWDGRYYESSTLNLYNNLTNLFFFLAGEGREGAQWTIVYYILDNYYNYLNLSLALFFFQPFRCSVRHSTTMSADWILLIRIILAICSSATPVVLAVRKEANKQTSRCEMVLNCSRRHCRQHCDATGCPWTCDAVTWEDNRCWCTKCLRGFCSSSNSYSSNFISSAPSTASQGFATQISTVQRKDNSHTWCE